MKLTLAFLRLIRWPNLVFIILTQVLFYTSIINGLTLKSADGEPVISLLYFCLVCIASVLIAGAGYIINDYFDINIDRINKPGKMVVDQIITRRWAILLHFLLSLLGLLVTAYLAWKLGSILLFLFNTACVALLWFYSTTLKKEILVGNIAISLLTAWVIGVLYLVLTSFHKPGLVSKAELLIIYKFASLYAGFAFMISVIREVVKDIEDVEGDMKNGCRTMPIVWGIPVAKVFTAVWLIVIVGLLGVLQFYVWYLGWRLFSIYCAIFIMIPLIWVGIKLYHAQNSKEYHRISTVTKMIMFTGIMSMIFIKYYAGAV